MLEKIILPSASILIESTRSIGYSFPAALADIIDNSISVNSKEINVNFRSLGEPYICIIDDGWGMNEEELELAMKYGSQSSLQKRAENDLGRFGLGLKMASLSQCRQLTVITKKSARIFGARWDLDFIVEKNDWVLLKLDEEEINAIPHIDILRNQQSGTIVMWRDFDRIKKGSTNLQKILDEKIEEAREHIALVFHRFMTDDNISRRIRIYFNKDKVDPIDPFLSTHTATQPLIEQIVRINDCEIKVKPFILPYISKLSLNDLKVVGGKEDLRQRQGFYVYRNKRLIIWGTWFGLIKRYELNKLARIRVDIPSSLDSIWQIDIKKSAASLPDLIKKNLIAIVENAVGRSENVYKYRGREVKHDKLQHVWNKFDNRGKFQYLINRDLFAFKMLEDKLDEDGIVYLDTFIKMVEDAFPYSAVYYDLGKNEFNLGEPVLENNDVYASACNMINQIKAANGDIEAFIGNIDKLDFFLRYPDVIKKIREEYTDE